MGLFDFARNIGKKIFGKEEEAPEALAQHINEDNPGVNGLQVQVQDGVATLTGEASSAEALEKAVLMAGNAMGIQEVKADGMTIADGSQVGGDDEFYIIEKGDTLWKIAEKAYGNGSKYTKIVEVNREVIKNADLIFPGQKIRIPKSI
ncbi:peptidoglycan-binding protein LysM [Candidatus Thiothrix anitrata]|jgi:nucleoid-associated protein YgaU|uniref:Peptidoglycan-binding protein LysM n=1 Tax=Candidatus Thiothrix anitrata TaxID=2823902 RepID=A0ABX7X025_9GAMM|nr:peptidoglycan-binding protein LysM [Candidatus Thiothrix anitrata]QTR49314.1 peptidoglycan-binding protein LysM [Candidatus Thiothrix anitrata]